MLGVGCGELGEDFSYRGVRLLDRGDYYVSTVAWLQYLPVAFASRAEQPGQSRVLRLVPLGADGVSPCATQPATRFIAVGESGDYRVAVLDGATGELGFYDVGCQRVGPAFSDVDRIDYLDDYYFLVRTQDDSVHAVQPFEETVATLGHDVWATGAQTVLYSLTADTPLQLGIWVLDGDVLALRDMRGNPLGPRYEGTRRFATHRGPSLTSTRLMAYETAEGITLVEAASALPLDDAGEVHAEELWGLPGACDPHFVEVQVELELGECDLPDCEGLTGLGPQQTVSVQMPWLAAYHPCSARRLVLYEVYGLDENVVAEGVQRYVVASTPVDGQTAVVYALDDVPEGEPTTYYRRGSDPPIAFEVPVDLDVWTEEPSLFPLMRLVTAEERPRYGTWGPKSGFTELLRDVYPSPNMTLVLHEYVDVEGEPRRGTLSRCGRSSCAVVAQGVPPDRYREYDTIERIGDGPRVLAFIHDLMPKQQGGTLSAIRRDTGQRADLDEGVTSFSPIENGPARGIVYAVHGGEREGLWFAPR